MASVHAVMEPGKKYQLRDLSMLTKLPVYRVALRLSNLIEQGRVANETIQTRNGKAVVFSRVVK